MAVGCAQSTAPEPAEPPVCAATSPPCALDSAESSRWALRQDGHGHGHGHGHCPAAPSARPVGRDGPALPQGGEQGPGPGPRRPPVPAARGRALLRRLRARAPRGLPQAAREGAGGLGQGPAVRGVCGNKKPRDPRGAAPGPAPAAAV